jgi:hypothetical protein
VRELKERGEYTRSRLVTAWGLTHGRPASCWQQLATRLQDSCLPRPSQDTPTGRTLQDASHCQIHSHPCFISWLKFVEGFMALHCRAGEILRPYAEET